MSDAAVGSAGAMLRAAREQRGLHIAALAAAIKVAPRKLDALENDRWDELPDATFTRALASTVCRTLKIDPAPVLERMPVAGVAALDAAGSGLNMPFRDKPGREAIGVSAAAIGPMVWAGGLLMVAAVVVYLLPASLWSPRPPPSAAVVAPAASVPARVPAASAAGLSAATAASGAPPSAPATEIEGPTAQAQPVVVPPVVEEPVSAAPSASAPPPAAAPVATQALQLRATAASWVEVRDANGAIRMSRLLQAGERVAIDANPPLRVVIGNASATELVFQGHPVDLAAHARDNVARLDLP